MSDDSKYQQALRTPSEVYVRPGDVLKDEVLDPGQKREVLTHWEAEAIRLQESEAEGMGGGERSLLPDIKRALSRLSDDR